MQVGSWTLNWFDVFVITVLIVGFYRGRQRGVSEELLDVFQWLAIVVVSAIFYESLGAWLHLHLGLERWFANVGGYLFFAVVLKFIFGWFKQALGKKLITGDFFGRLEYLLGIIGGGVRYGCMLLVALAVLNAREFTAGEIAHHRQMQKENLGSIRFPTWPDIQRWVFQSSQSGRWTKRYLGAQLITPTVGGDGGGGNNMADRREQDVEEVIDGR